MSSTYGDLAAPKLETSHREPARSTSELGDKRNSFPTPGSYRARGIATCNAGGPGSVVFQYDATYRSILGVAGATATTPWGVWNWGGRGFISDDGYAQEIGPDGTGAYGELPQIYLTGDDTAFPVNWGLAGGTYTPTGGSLTAAPTDPFP